MMGTRGVRALLGVIAAILSCGFAKAQVFNCYEGKGVLENNWNDWSWCADNFQSTQFTYSGPYSLQVTFTGAWQGFSLESSTSFPAGYFKALTFMINGGNASGRSIQFAMTVNGSSTNSVNLNNYVQGGSVAANTWRQVTIPLSAFNLHPTDQISRFWLQESSGAAQPAFYIDQLDWVANPAPLVVSLKVNTAVSQRTVDQKMFGVNTAIWDGGFTSTTCKNLMAQAAFKAMRFPGGSASDGYHWATNTSDTNTWTWGTGFDDFASVAVPTTGGQCFITANYGTGTPSEAAAWVQYSNITKGYGMKYWEIGNECYGTWEEDSHAHPNDPVTYATQFAAYYQAMKAVDPTIQIGAVSTPGEDGFVNYSSEVVTNPRTGLHHSGWTPVMLATMAGLGVKPDFIIYHRYPEYVSECDFTLLIGNSGWATDMADLRQQMTDYLGSTSSTTQIMCTENNCDAGNEGKQMCSLVNGVFMADTFGTILQTECNSFMWWDFINGQSTTGDNGSWLYGWRMYGDEGVISPDFTQTYPVFYVEQLFNRFAMAGDSVLSTTSSYGLLSTFATKRTDGSVRVMVVNKNPTATLLGNLSFAGGTTAPPLSTKYFYGMPQDNAARNGLPQAIAITHYSSTGVFPVFSFPPYSVTVLEFGASASLR